MTRTIRRGEGDQGAGEQRINEYDGEGNARRGEVRYRKDYESDDAGHDTAAERRHRDRLELADAGVPPQPAVHAGCVEDQQPKGYGQK